MGLLLEEIAKNIFEFVFEVLICGLLHLVRKTLIGFLAGTIAGIVAFSLLPRGERLFTVTTAFLIVWILTAIIVGFISKSRTRL